jgi:hypothetical protein
MKTKMKLVLLAALGSLALAAHAQDAGGPPPGDGQNDGPGGGGGRHHPPIPAIVRALDTNHDGIIDSNEIANASAALMTLDKKGDGKLTWDEYMGPRPHGRPQGGDGPDANSGDAKDNEGPPGPPPGDDQNGGPGGGGHHHHPPIPAIVRALDTNHDGIIDASEIANASAALKTLDKNGDGRLTRDEYLGKRPGPPPDADDDHGAGGPPDGPPPGN